MVSARRDTCSCMCPGIYTTAQQFPCTWACMLCQLGPADHSGSPLVCVGLGTSTVSTRGGAGHWGEALARLAFAQRLQLDSSEDGDEVDGDKKEEGPPPGQGEPSGGATQAEGGPSEAQFAELSDLLSQVLANVGQTVPPLASAALDLHARWAQRHGCAVGGSVDTLLALGEPPGAPCCVIQPPALMPQLLAHGRQPQAGT
jgi:hypothetical protein